MEDILCLEQSLLEYDMCLMENLLEDYRLELYISESISLASDDRNFKAFRSLHENSKEKQKNIFAKLIDTIQKLWFKFSETMNGLLTTDTKYLEKYKDIILNTPLKEDTYIMYPYWNGEKYITESKVPAFNYANIRQYLQSEETFLNQYFKQFVQKDVSFSDRTKQLMRGGFSEEQRIKSANIDMTKLYNYCMDFNKLIAIIKDDMKQVESAGNKAIETISSMKTTNTSNNEQFMYSFLKEQVLVEEVKKLSTTPTTDGETNSGKLKSNIDGDKNTDSGTIKDLVKDKEDDLDRVRLYIKICYNFLGAKMSIAQETYKGYMFIIKDHVKAQDSGKSKSNVSKDDTEEDKKGAKENTKDTTKETEKTPDSVLNKLKNFLGNKK